MKFDDVKNNITAVYDYKLIKMDKDCGNIHVYDMMTHYIGSFFLMSGKLTFNNKSYKDPVDLIKDMLEYNKTLKYPAAYYDPIMRKMYSAQYVIDEYMKNLGFSVKYHHSYGKDMAEYTLNNMYNTGITVINVSWDDADKESGIVNRFISDFSWVSGGKFENVDECIAKLNSVIEPELLINIENAFSVLNKITTDHDYESMTFNRFDPKTISSEVYDNYAIALKEKLQNALDRINSINKSNNN